MRTRTRNRYASYHFPGFLAAAFALVFVWVLSGCDGDADHGADLSPQNLPPLTSEDLLAPGPFSVGYQTIKLVDTSRPTDPNGWFWGASTRTLQTYVWYPVAEAQPTLAASAGAAAGRPYPLIVYSHGFMSYGTEAQYLTEHLASYGYVVVSPTFPLTNLLAPGGPNLMDVANQPGDQSFLIDTFLKFSQDPESPFHGLVDGSRVGAAGLSLGGMTTSLLTYHPYLRDPRIAAAVSIAGPGCMFGETFYLNSQAPLLTVCGDIDAMVDYEANALFMLEMAGPKVMVATLQGASHTGFSHAAGLLMEYMDNPDSIGCQVLTSGSDLEADFVTVLGGAEAGIIEPQMPTPCSVFPLPTALRPSRQHELTTLAVLSYFESRFAASELSRTRAARFLTETLAARNPEVTIQ